MSVEIVNVAYWKSLFPNNVAPDVTYYIHDSAEAVEGLPASEMSGPLGAIVWTGSSLVLDAAQASAILKAAVRALQNGSIIMSSAFLDAASTGGKTILTDTAAAVLALSPPNDQSLNSFGFNPVVITDSAGNIQKLSASQIQQAATLGVSAISITSTNTSLVLDADQVIAFEKAAINLVVPTNDTVHIADNAANILALSAQQINDLQSNNGVQAIGIVDTAANIDNLTISQIQAAAALGVTTITSDGSLALDAAQAIALAEAAISLIVPAKDTVTASGTETAAQLVALDPTKISELPRLGVTDLIVDDDVRPLFDIDQEAAITKASLTVIEPFAGNQLSLSQLPGFDFAQGSTYFILDTGSDVDNLSVGTIQSLPSSVTSISVGGSVLLDVDQAVALENAGLPINAPDGSVGVVDTAAALETLSPAQLTALGFIGVTSVAASDTPAVFSADQMNALATGSVAVVAPPDSTQNDGSTTISPSAGNNLTFQITWDSSVASAPAAFQTDVDAAFQYYADTFTAPSPVTFYYTVGFGEAGGGALGSDDLGENFPNRNSDETFADLLGALDAGAESPAQKLAMASLLAADPNGLKLQMSTAEEKVLGLTNADTDATSSTDPDDALGISGDSNTFSYSTNPDQVDGNNYDIIGTVEHEFSEGLGRINDPGNANTTHGPPTAYEPIELFRFAGANQPTLSPSADPAYFSIDDGVTPLGYWNNGQIDPSGDLADWAQNANPPNSDNTYTPDSYNDDSNPGIVNPITATDVTLMNVLGYELASPTETPTLPPLLNVLFFDGNDANGNNALWVSGGTAATTQELVGVNGIAGDTVTASGITVFGSNVLFDGSDLYDNDGLWISNGSPWGTQQITGIADAASAAQGGLDPTDLTVVGNDVWFDGKDSSGNVGLWETDGTAAGTHELVAGLVASNMTIYDDEVYFTGADGGLWKTDGTAGGTVEIAGAPDTSLGQYNGYTLTAASTSTFPTDFAANSFDVLNGKLLFGGAVLEQAPGQTPVGTHLLFAWDGTSLQALGPGPTSGGITNDTGAAAGIAYYTSSTYNDGFPSNSDYNNALTGADIYQTDGTSAGTAVSDINGLNNNESDLTSLDGYMLYSGAPDTSVSVLGGGTDFSVTPGFDLSLAGPFTPPTAVQYAVNGQTEEFTENLDTPFGAEEGLNSPVVDLVNGVYALNVGDALNNSADLFAGAQSNTVGQGFDPTDMTVFDGNVYFNGVDSAGQNEMWVLQPNTAGSPTGPFWLQILPGNLPTLENDPDPGVILGATGADFAGIAGASSTGLDPSNITALTIPRTTTLVPITEGQLLVDETLDQINPGSATAPAGEGFVLTDTALDIESLTAAEITAGVAIGLDAVASTDASVVFTADMAEALEPSVYVMAPAGDTVTIADHAGSIEAMSDSQLSELTGIGVSAIMATDASLVLTFDQALALAKPVVVAAPTDDVTITPPLGDTVSVRATAGQIQSLTSAQIIALKSIGVSTLTAGGSVELTAAQAVALADPLPVTAPSGDTVIISDTAAHIDALTPDQIAALPGIGVSAIQVTDAAAVLQLSQVNEIAAAGLQFSVSPNNHIMLAGSAADVIEMTTAQIDSYASLGVTEIATSSGVTLSVAQVDELEKDGISLVQGTGTLLSVTVEDTPAHIETLDPQEIDGLARLSPNFAHGITSQVVPIGTITLDVAQFGAIEQNEISIDQAYLAIADSADRIETLTAAEITALGNYRFAEPVNVSITQGSELQFRLDQALAIAGNNNLGLGYVNAIELAGQPPGTAIMIADTVSDFEKLTVAQIDALAHFDQAEAANVSFQGFTPDGSLVLNAAQAEAAAADNLSFSVPTGDTVGIGDVAANISGFLDLGATEVAEVVHDLNISGIAATDGSIGLSVSEAEMLETVNANSGRTVAITAPAGDAVTLSDTAADIEAMSPAQLSGLSAIGVTAVDVTDRSITLTVPQALALYDPVPISVPTGDTVIVADTEAEIDSLTPAEVAGLAAIGVRELDVSNLTGAGPLTIDGGVTLAISGTVPANETITFAGTGGTLSLDDTADMAGTIYGFSPPDTIHLTDVPFDFGGLAGLATDPDDGQQAIQVNANSSTYYLDIDPSQIFLTPPTFELNPDSLTSVNPGTDLTVVEPIVTDESLQVLSGQTSDGIVISSGGEVEVESGATVNRAVVQSGGELLGDVGSTINDAFIDTGGLLDLSTGAAGTGRIDFGSPIGAPPVGGKLEIDDLYLPAFTIDGFANGDTIDLTALTYDLDGSVNLESGNVLDVNADGTTYTLQLDPTQNFNGDYFHLAPDNANGTDITENTTPCYCRGTLIQTQRGQTPVENLKIGDRVMTRAGVTRPIKWIGRRSYGGHFIMGRKDILPICIRAGALDDNVPRRDLWISPHHAMYLEGVLIEAKDLINGVSIVQAGNVEKVEYFHIELDAHDIIFAEGAMSESFIDDDSRGLFHNAHEYRSLYPGAAAVSAQYCAPRLDHGYQVEGARRRLAHRAQLTCAADGPHIGPLRGYVDAVRPNRIEGWAQNMDHPDAPVCLDIYADGRLIGQTLANRYREDLKGAGLGSGCHSFVFTPSAGIVCAPNVVEVCRSLDGARLARSASRAIFVRQTAV